MMIKNYLKIVILQPNKIVIDTLEDLDEFARDDNNFYDMDIDENQDQHIDDLLNSEPKREDTVGGIDSTQKIYDELPEFFIGSNNEKVLKNGTARFTGTNHLFVNDEDENTDRLKNELIDYNEEYEINPMNNSDSFDFAKFEQRDKGFSICDIPKPQIQKLNLKNNEKIDAGIFINKPSVSNSYDPSAVVNENNHSNNISDGISINKSLDFNSLR